MGGFSSHPAILRHQLSILQFTKFWPCLPGDRFRSHRLRAQSHKISPTVQMPTTSPGHHLVTGQDPMRSSQDRPTPPPSFVCLFLNYYYFFLAALSLHCCSGFSVYAVSRGYSLVVGVWLLLLGSTGSGARRLHELQHMSSVVVVPGL